MARFVRRWRLHRTGMALVASAYVVLALWLGSQGAELGAELLGGELSPMSSSSAIAILSSIASGMMAFTGIVFSLVLVSLQLGNSVYSPRLFDELGRHRLLPHAVGVFTGTFAYALLAIRTVDLEERTGINTPVAVTALIWILASIAMLVVLLPKIASLSVSGVLGAVGARGREAAARIYGPLRGDARPDEARAPRRGEGRSSVQPLLYEDDVPRYLVGLDEAALIDEAARIGGVVRIPHPIGAVVLEGDALAFVEDARAPISKARLRKAIWLDDERWTDNDPAYALRLLVDIAIRALSPAINDPGTAVDALDQIQSMLHVLGRSRPDAGVVRDDAGQVLLVFETPTWDELVALALDEIRQYGRDSRTVQRRIAALARELLAVVPPERHPALLRAVGREEIAPLS